MMTFIPNRLNWAIFAIVLPLLFIPHISQGQNNIVDKKLDSKLYRCPPCGCILDKERLDKPGLCKVCRMDLIEVKSEKFENLRERTGKFLKNRASNIEFYDLVEYPAFLIGFLLGIFYLVNARKAYSNLFLGLMFISLTSYALLFQLNVDVGPRFTIEYRLLFLPLSLISGFGIFLYWYIHSYKNPEFILKKSELILLLPALGLNLYFLYFFLKDTEERIGIAMSSNVLNPVNVEQYLIIASGLIATLYIALRFDSIVKNRKLPPREVRKLKYLNYFFLIFFAFWLMLLAFDYFVFDFGLTVMLYFPLWLAEAILVYALIFYAKFRLDDVLLQSRIKDSPKYLRGMTRNEIKKYSDQLLQIMIDQKIYLNKQLTLNNLAELLRVSSKDLTIILNRGLNKSFYDLVNEYRVAEAKRQLLDPNTSFNVIEVASLSGFTSRSSFNNVFKKITGFSPKAYRDKNFSNNELDPPQESVVGY